MTSRPSTAAPILAVLAIVLVTLGAYVGGYFWLGQESSVGPDSVRVYQRDWQATAFKPAGWVESTLRGREVRVMSLRELIEICKPPSASTKPAVVMSLQLSGESAIRSHNPLP